MPPACNAALTTRADVFFSVGLQTAKISEERSLRNAGTNQRKTVALTIRSAKLTGGLLARAMNAALRKMKQARDAPPHGKQTLKQLAKQNAGLSNIEITDRNIKSFEPYARKYGIDYALKRTPP